MKFQAVDSETEPCYLKMNTNNMNCLIIKPTKWPCPQRRIRPAWVSAQSELSLRCALSE